jgi:hypothetical protein
MSIPITWTTAQRLPITSVSSWRQSIGLLCDASMTGSAHDPPNAGRPHTGRRFARVGLWIGCIRTREFQVARRERNRARVIGNDITDASYWSDGALMRDEIGRKWTGVWKIQNNKHCMSNPSSKLLNCHEVWMSGENIRLR